ncbi:MAG: hypothetical protein IT342_16815 [Candidatus Melainabacteria bacterium]|nr:hypothetical protein [Candidatus Melainabacteria bacterium]
MTSSCYRTKDDNETFFKEGLEKLRNESLQESSGKLIMDLMEIHDDKILVTFARQWIKQFPNQESAPRLVGKWLLKYETNDAMYMATNYVKTYPDVNALILIIRAAGKMPRVPSRLFAAIERRFEAEPNSHVWAALLGYENQSPERNKLAVRWIQKNFTNTSIDIDLSSVAAFTESPEVLEEIFIWTKHNQERAENVWMLFCHMMRGQSKAHKNILPRVVELARAWLAKNPDYDYNGRIYSDLLIVMRSEDDIQNAKEWYRSHTNSQSAAMAMNGILSSMHLRGDPPEQEFIKLAKQLLNKQSPEDRVPVLAGALLLANPEAESIKLARETWEHYRHLAWLHGDLLRLAPDADLITEANERLSTFDKGLPDVIIEMLKIDPANDVARRAAEKWLQLNGDDDQVNTVKALL